MSKVRCLFIKKQFDRSLQGNRLLSVGVGMGLGVSSEAHAQLHDSKVTRFCCMKVKKSVRGPGVYFLS